MKLTTELAFTATVIAMTGFQQANATSKITKYQQLVDKIVYKRFVHGFFAASNYTRKSDSDPVTYHLRCKVDNVSNRLEWFQRVEIDGAMHVAQIEDIPAFDLDYYENEEDMMLQKNPTHRFVWVGRFSSEAHADGKHQEFYIKNKTSQWSQETVYSNRMVLRNRCRVPSAKELVYQLPTKNGIYENTASSKLYAFIGKKWYPVDKNARRYHKEPNMRLHINNTYIKKHPKMKSFSEPDNVKNVYIISYHKKDLEWFVVMRVPAPDRTLTNCYGEYKIDHTKGGKHIAGVFEEYIGFHGEQSEAFERNARHHGN